MYLIGYVLKPQGVRGEIKIKPVSENLERYSQLDTVHIKKSKTFNKTYAVQHVRISDRFVYLKLLEIETRDEAAVLRGAEVLIGEKELLQPSENEYFIHDLVGCQVFSDQGELIGQLEEVMQLSSNDVWVVRDEARKEILLPAIKDVISQVDVRNKKITIHVIEGLLD